MENRLPFIAAIISGLITAGATAFYVADYFPLMVIVIVLAITILRFNSWALIGGVLVGLAILEYQAGGERFQVIVILLIIGSLFQVITALLVGVNSATILDRSTVWQNTVFAGIGITAVFGAYLWIWGDSAPPSWGLTRELDFIYVLFRVFAFAVEPTARISLGDDGKLSYTDVNPALTEYEATGELTGDVILGLLNMFALFLARTILVAPPTWAAFFAALRQVGFRFWEVGPLFRQTMRGYGGGSLAVLFGMAVTAILLIASLGVSTNAPMLGNFLTLLGFANIYFFFSLGAGMGVRRGLS